MWWFALVLAAAPAERAAVSEHDKGLVLDVATTGDIDADDAAALGDRVAVSVASAARFEVLSKDELRQLSTLAAEKQQSGCDSDACLTELAGALDARFVVQPRLSRLGSEILLTLTVFDAVAGKAIGRAQRAGDSVVAVGDVVDDVVADALDDADALRKRKKRRAAAVSRDDDGVGAGVIAGGVVVGVGVVSTAVGAGVLLYAESQLASPAALSEPQYRALQSFGRIGLGVGAGIGAAAIAAGVIVIVVGGAE